MFIPDVFRGLNSQPNVTRSGKGRRFRAGHIPTSRKLVLERLEDRNVPSTLTVTNALDDGSPGSLRYAIAQANTDAAAGISDTINFDPGLAGATIVLTQGQLELSGAGAGKITIDGSGLSSLIAISGNNASRVLKVDTGVTAELDKLALQNGRSDDNGGGILTRGMTTVNECTLLANYASGTGGGMFAGGTTIVRACTFAGNGAIFGGGMIARAATTVDHCTFDGNYALADGVGGGIISYSATVTACTFAGNSAVFEGGGMFAEGGTISGCNFSGNSTRRFGGGMSSTRATVSDCTFSGNTAVRGGGMYSYTGSVNGCTFSDNSALPLSYNYTSQGGGMYACAGTTVSGCNFSGNTVPVGNGGGIESTGATVYGCTFSGNIGYGEAFGGTGTISGCTFSGNPPLNGDATGPALILEQGTSTVSSCTISGNSGGGIINVYRGPVTVTNCTLSGNSGAGIVNYGTMTVSSCTISGNHMSSGFNGGGIINDGYGTLTVSGCIVSGNSAYYGGGVGNGGATAIIRGSIVSGNSAVFSGGGVCNWGSGTLTVENESDFDFYGLQTSDINSGIYNNQSPIGADLENEVGGMLTLSHSAVVNIDNQNPAGTTITFSPDDTATVMTAAVSPFLPSQAVFNVQVLAVQTGGATPTGTVTLYDGNNTALASANLNSGLATFTVSLESASHGPIHAVYSGDGSFYTGSTSAPVVQTVVDAQTKDDLQNLITSLASSSAGTGVQVTLDANSFYSFQPSSTSYAQSVANAISQVTAPAGNRVVINFNAPENNYGDLMLSTQQNVSLVVNFANGTQVVGNSPALVVTGGDVIVANATFTTATDSPTIQVTGGHLTVRNAVVQESTAYSDAAIAVSGGSTVDLGTASSPGGNTISVNGGGQVILSRGLNVVSTVGTTFQANASTIYPAATVGLTSSANPSLLNQPVTFTATVTAPSSSSPAPTGSVTFVDMTAGSILGTVALSGGVASLSLSSLAVNAHPMAAVYSGDASYITNSATVIQRVNYRFSGFLAPLNSTLSFGLNRTIPIKFQLTDYNKNSLSSLGAVSSLKALNSQGTNVLTNPGSTFLRYDSTANQFVGNWQTKGLAAGKYTVTLVLADGITYTKSVTLSKNGSPAGVMVDGTATTTATGALLGGDITLYVNNANGDLTADELARIQDAVTAMDGVTEPYGVAVMEVTDPTLADVTLNMDATSAVGGFADGVLGCTADAGQITIIQGWEFYAGSDASQIGSGQFDFETVVLHELGHALGLGHSVDSTSVMYATLASGAVNRALCTADLNLADAHDGACGLHVAQPVVPTSGVDIDVEVGMSISMGNPLPASDLARNAFFALPADQQTPSNFWEWSVRGSSRSAAHDALRSVASVTTRNRSRLLAGPAPREVSDLLFDVPLFPVSGQNG